MGRRKLPPELKHIAEAAQDLADISPEDIEYVRLRITDAPTAVDAFRRSRDVSHLTEASVYAMAARLERHKHIQAWLHAARAAGLASINWSKERYIRECEGDRARLAAKGDERGAHECLKTIGQVCGFHIERHMEVPFDPIEALNDIAAKHPEYAIELAREAGLKDWKPPSQIAH